MDLEAKMYKLAKLDGVSASERVFVWRDILTATWREGFDAGCMAALRDRAVVDNLVEQEARDRG